MHADADNVFVRSVSCCETPFGKVYKNKAAVLQHEPHVVLDIVELTQGSTLIGVAIVLHKLVRSDQERWYWLSAKHNWSCSTCVMSESVAPLHHIVCFPSAAFSIVPKDEFIVYKYL